MRETRIIMGMPVTVELADPKSAVFGERAMKEVFDYFCSVDERFSTYKETSEISAINSAIGFAVDPAFEVIDLPYSRGSADASGAVDRKNWSSDMIEIFELSEKTKMDTNGFFDIRRPDGRYDPSGIVKGWAIRNAAKILENSGFNGFYIEAGGDIQTHGTNQDRKWSVGIRNPFFGLAGDSSPAGDGNNAHLSDSSSSSHELVATVYLSGEGIATSGRYIRGNHIYNPLTGSEAEGIASLTVIADDVYEADRFATAAFAMGGDAMDFIESKPGLEGYMIKNDGSAVSSGGFSKFTEK